VALRWQHRRTLALSRQFKPNPQALDSAFYPHTPSRLDCAAGGANRRRSDGHQTATPPPPWHSPASSTKQRWRTSPAGWAPPGAPKQSSPFTSSDFWTRTQRVCPRALLSGDGVHTTNWVKLSSVLDLGGANPAAPSLQFPGSSLSRRDGASLRTTSRQTQTQRTLRSLSRRF